MEQTVYRIESSGPLNSRFVPTSGKKHLLVRDRNLAIVLAERRRFDLEPGQALRVVHVASGEVVYSDSPVLAS